MSVSFLGSPVVWKRNQWIWALIQPAGVAKPTMARWKHWLRLAAIVQCVREPLRASRNTKEIESFLMRLADHDLLLGNEYKKTQRFALWRFRRYATLLRPHHSFRRKIGIALIAKNLTIAG